MFAQVNSLGLFGMNAFPVQVETDISRGQPMFEVVGLPDLAVRESRERIKSALRACGIAFPVARVMVNLAPANTKKSGSVYDLAILMAILQATGRLPALPSDSCFLGEVSLNGGLRPVSGVLPMVLLARKLGISQIFLPAENAYEASVASGIAVYGVENVKQLLEHFDGEHALTPQPPYAPSTVEAEPVPDFSDVRGQNFAKRALEIAAAGGHNTLLIGTPGSGKSMLAKRMPGILPEMTFAESIETTNIHSVAGLLNSKHPLVTVRPFRSPHHTISAAGLAGGGSIPRPGEISLAHNGLLFLDELAEFDRRTLEILRQPLEDHTVTISRASGTVTYPCTIMLIAAMNPCPCGYYGHPQRKCTCASKQVQQYLSKVSGPLLDRFDLHVDVAPVGFEELTGTGKEESSAEIRTRVQAARHIQQQRFAGTSITCNAQITPDLLRTYCPMTDRAQQRLRDVFDRMGLSARAYDRLLKVARTIADLDGADTLDLRHVTEAVQYRSLDRKYKTQT
ncbi:YifB family Mg chelatase-like AAA ATPase [Ruminococcus sp.]|uniref:YifB family Mg chelatase-like AAA ATPase n=1 Tax=Ruminococcus sp. TaxID=41978 RepID=UPI003F007982